MTQKKTLWPGWEVGRVLGRGGFSTVYEIYRDNFGVTEYAALKVISVPQDRSDIEDLRLEGYDEKTITGHYRSYMETIVGEYNLMTRLKGHANIVYCDDLRYIQHDDGIGWDIYIKMELLKPLGRALEEDPTEAQVLALGRDICAALELCRENGILHRDLKPQNIFVSRDGTYKLGDFGIAKVHEKTSSGTKIGTYKYMAPEVYKGLSYGHRADIYSLGLVLYWMLNRRRLPFLPQPPEPVSVNAAEDAQGRRILGEALPRPATGSRELQDIVLKACAYDPQDRFASAGEMLEALEALPEPREQKIPVKTAETEEETADEGDRTDGIFRSWEEREQLRKLKEEEERLRQESERLKQEQERLRQAEEKRRAEEEERLRREMADLEQALHNKAQWEELKLIGLTVLGVLLVFGGICSLSPLLLLLGIYVCFRAWKKGKDDPKRKKVVITTVVVASVFMVVMVLYMLATSQLRF